MSASLSEKIRILLEAVKVLKNWQMFVVLYFNLVKSEYVIFETRNGTRIKLRVDSTDMMAFTHVWLLREYKRAEFDIKNDDIIIDIGAHIGLFALYSSQFCKDGKIYCFEPIRENFEMLKANIELNGIKNIVATNAAVSSNNGVVTVYINDDEAGHSMHVIGAKSVQVDSISLQRIIDSHDVTQCDFLKLDCEGEEYEIIDSLPAEYFDRIKKICIEYHFADTKPDLLDGLIKRLRFLSYKIVTRNILPGIGFLYALR